MSPSLTGQNHLRHTRVERAASYSRSSKPSFILHVYPQPATSTSPVGLQFRAAISDSYACSVSDAYPLSEPPAYLRHCVYPLQPFYPLALVCPKRVSLCYKAWIPGPNLRYLHLFVEMFMWFYSPAKTLADCDYTVTLCLHEC